jgi:ankyrin repeat protein
MGAVNRRRRKKLQARLLEAAAWADAGDLARLLRAGADPDRPGPGGTLPLYRASVQDRPDNVAALLAAGADPNRESGLREEGLPLCAAACWGHEAAVLALLAGGADPRRREDAGTGRTAIEWAEAGGHATTLELLLAPRFPPPNLTDSALAAGAVGMSALDGSDHAGRKHPVGGLVGEAKLPTK